MPSVEAVNFDELRQAFTAAPVLTARFVKTDLLRFARRVRRLTIRERLSGGDGIKGGQFRKGKHIQGFTVGKDLATLKAVSKISRILRVHEEGGTITPKKGAWLFLSKKTGVSGKGQIFARVRSVTIPARLGFQQVWSRAVPDAQAKIADSMERAMRVAMEQRMKAVSGFVQRAVA